MAAMIPPILKLQQSIEQIDPWIKANKPDPSKSQQVFSAFMERYGTDIQGSAAFIAKTNRIIEKVSRLATGITLLERLLEIGHKIIIQEGKEAGCRKDKRESWEPAFLTFSFCSPKIHYVYLNDHQERSFFRQPHPAVFIHESLHAWHSLINYDATETRGVTPPHLSDMSNAEEELTITGNLHLATNTDLCCENSALRELNCPLRFCHRGTYQNDLHSWVQERILSKIREISESRQIHNNKNNEGLTPLELAMQRYLLENDPKILQEWIQIIHMLIQAGCHSEYALKLAILQNSATMIMGLLQAGAPLTDDLLNCAIQERSVRYRLLWTLLEEQKWVISLKEMCPEGGYCISGDLQTDPTYQFFKKHLEQLGRQIQTVQDKCIQDGTLPMHIFEKCYDQGLIRDPSFFSKWRQLHMYRPAGEPESLTEAAPIPSPTVQNHVFYEELRQLNHPCLTLEEMAHFVKVFVPVVIEPQGCVHQ